MTIRRGDTHPIYWRIVDQTTGLPVDLTGATAEIHVKLKNDAAITLPAAVELSGGRVRYDPDGSLGVGVYALEIEVTKDGKISTAPSKMNDSLTVIADLA